MIAHVRLYKISESISDERIDELMRHARSQLLKIGEVLYIRSGKRVSETNAWEFFIYLEYQNLNKMRICHDDPIFLKFLHDHITPNIAAEQEFTYELEPGKDTKYS